MASNRTRTAVAALGLSAAAFVGLLQHEGFRGEAYHATADEKARGIYTIGFGTTEGVKQGDKITVERALGRALTDSAKFEGAVKECVKVPLHQYEYDAYVSLAYNIGKGKSGVADGFCYSKRGGYSTLVRKLNAGDYAGACAEISRWNKQSGKVLPGLTKRRADERAKCEGVA
jgi:lysozyme